MEHITKPEINITRKRALWESNSRFIKGNNQAIYIFDSYQNKNFEANIDVSTQKKPSAAPNLSGLGITKLPI